MARLLGSPAAIIAKDGFYCGGDFNFWGRAMQALLSVRLVPGTPHRIEITIGLSRGLRQVAGVVDAINTLAMRPGSTANSVKRYMIPVPVAKHEG